MALTIKSLAAGTVKSATASTVDVLLGSSTKSTLIKNISLVNNNSLSATIQYIKLRRYVDSGPNAGTGYVEFPVAPLDLRIPPMGQIVLDSEITMGVSANNATPTPATAPDQLVMRLTSDATNGVTYVINGLERDF